MEWYTIILSPVEKANILASYYEKLSHMPTPSVDMQVLLLPATYAIIGDYASEYNSPITMLELTFVIAFSKGTCPGHDMLHNEFFLNMPSPYIERVLLII